MSGRVTLGTWLVCDRCGMGWRLGYAGRRNGGPCGDESKGKLGQPCRGRLWRSDQPRGTRTLAECIARGYVVGRGVELCNRWYAWCKAHRRPYVRVGLYGRSAVVAVDLFPTPWDFTAEAQALVGALLVDATTQATARRPAVVAAGPDRAETTRCPASAAEALARTLLAFAMDGRNLTSHRAKWATA